MRQPNPISAISLGRPRLLTASIPLRMGFAVSSVRSSKGAPKDMNHAIARGLAHPFFLWVYNLRPAFFPSSSKPYNHLPPMDVIRTMNTGEIPLQQIQAEFSSKFGSKIDVLENKEKMENEAAA
jgi:hypothetical protein